MQSPEEMEHNPKVENSEIMSMVLRACEEEVYFTMKNNQLVKSDVMLERNQQPKE
jgi:hypothetical protein